MEPRKELIIGDLVMWIGLTEDGASLGSVIGIQRGISSVVTGYVIEWQDGCVTTEYTSSGNVLRVTQMVGK